MIVYVIAGIPVTREPDPVEPSYTVCLRCALQGVCNTPAALGDAERYGLDCAEQEHSYRKAAQ